MVVEIKQTDTPEEIERKLQVFGFKKGKVEDRKNVLKFFGCIKSNIDPVEAQRQIRSEWDEREEEQRKLWEASRFNK